MESSSRSENKVLNLSYDKKELQVGSKVYQVQLDKEYRVSVIQLQILEVNPNGQLRVAHASEGKKLQYNIKASEVHTDSDALLRAWEDRMIEYRDVVIPKQLESIRAKHVIPTEEVLSELNNIAIT